MRRGIAACREKINLLEAKISVVLERRRLENRKAIQEGLEIHGSGNDSEIDVELESLRREKILPNMISSV
jgi:hypothetical protein